MKKNLILGLLGVVLVTLFNLTTSSGAFASGKVAYEKMLQGKAVILDVRERDEVRSGMIKRAQWYPLSKIEDNKSASLEEIKKMASGKELYVYCRSGKRAGKVISYLRDVAVEAENLGGFDDLAKEGLPTTTLGKESKNP